VVEIVVWSIMVWSILVCVPVRSVVRIVVRSCSFEVAESQEDSCHVSGTCRQVD
jgi:hypothetical protein